MAIYAAINGQQTGPLNAQALQAAIAGGTLTKATLVWKQGLPNWVPAENVPEVASLFGSVPPPLPK